MVRGDEQLEQGQDPRPASVEGRQTRRGSGGAQPIHLPPYRSLAWKSNSSCKSGWLWGGCWATTNPSRRRHRPRSALGGCPRALLCQACGHRKLNSERDSPDARARGDALVRSAASHCRGRSHRWGCCHPIDLADEGSQAPTLGDEEGCPPCWPLVLFPSARCSAKVCTVRRTLEHVGPVV